MKSFLEYLKIIHNLYIKNKCFIKRNSYSQDGEDKVLREIFENHNSGVYVDVGCYHPIEVSNTALLYNKGWNGINIDISEYSIKLFNFLKPDDVNLNLAVSNSSGYKDIFFQKNLSKISTVSKKKSLKIFQGKIKTKKIICKTLTEIINDSIYRDKKINFLNIDAEGHDLEVLQSLDFHKYFPEVICVEIFPEYGNFNDFNLKTTPEYKFLVDRNYDLYWSGYFSHIFKINRN